MKLTEKIPASVSIIALNEESRISKCLASVKDFAEILVLIDQKTTDSTEAISRGFGARVFVEPWKGFGPQKQSAVEKCSHPWVLILDADEILPPETVLGISDTLEAPVADAYSFPRKNFLHGRWMKHSGYWPDRQTRLVNRSRGAFHGMLHEKWVTDGKIYDLNTPVEHYAFSDYSDMLKTMNDYSSIFAQELFAEGKRANLFSPLFHGISMFVKIYVLQLGILDGFDGLVTAVTKAGGSFFKYAKLLELRVRK